MKKKSPKYVIFYGMHGALNRNICIDQTNCKNTTA